MSKSMEQTGSRPEKYGTSKKTKVIAGVAGLALVGAGFVYGRSQEKFAPDNCTSLDHFQVDHVGLFSVQNLARTLNGDFYWKYPNNLDQLASSVNGNYGYDKIVAPDKRLTGQEILTEPENQKKASNPNSIYPVTADQSFGTGVYCFELPVPSGLTSSDVQNVVSFVVNNKNVNPNAALGRIRDSAERAGISLGK